MSHAPLAPRVLDPAPSAIERGAAARLHWRVGVTTDDALRAVATDGTLSPEWSAVLAETHARLLDPAGVRPLPTPSPIGAAVGRALEADPSWEGLVAASSLHPHVARETVAALAPLVRKAVVAADAAKLDGRRALQDLQAARAALKAARERAETAATPADKAQALREAVEAGRDEEQASSAYQRASAAGDRVEAGLAGAAAAVAAIAAQAQETADGIAAVMASGFGHAVGAASPAEIPTEVLEALTPEVTALLRLVSAIRAALRDGRAMRHLPGREGMLGPDVGGLDRVADARPLTLAGLSGALGTAYQTLTVVDLARGKAAVTEKGGGKANDGHVVIALDQSGSMKGARALWANALALATILEARAQNRCAVLVTFAERVRACILVDGPTPLRAALQACCVVSDGSDTDVRAALVSALGALTLLPHAGRGADTLLVTDGEWSADALRDWPIDDAHRLQAVVIAGSAPAHKALHATWEVDATGDDAASLAVSIARTVV